MNKISDYEKNPIERIARYSFDRKLSVDDSTTIVDYFVGCSAAVANLSASNNDDYTDRLFKNYKTVEDFNRFFPSVKDDYYIECITFRCRDKQGHIYSVAIHRDQDTVSFISKVQDKINFDPLMIDLDEIFKKKDEEKVTRL